MQRVRKRTVFAPGVRERSNATPTSPPYPDRSRKADLPSRPRLTPVATAANGLKAAALKQKTTDRRRWASKPMCAQLDNRLLAHRVGHSVMTVGAAHSNLQASIRLLQLLLR